jgi:two-component system, chemotaxis family, protein-glutamate methylesterase/glutaminase
MSDIVVVGASAGGVGAVRLLLSRLRPDIPAAVFVVVHTAADGPGLLPAVLGRGTPLTVVTAEDGAVIRSGYVYVAPPDYHLLVDGRHVRLSHGPKEHRFRPSVDALFRTAAAHYGPRTIGVVLSGHMADGTHGLTQIKDAGGVTIVQDPDEAEVPSMPLHAMRQGVDYVLPVQEMARVITGLLMNRDGRDAGPRKPVKPPEAPSPEKPEPDALRGGGLNGPPSPFTCPDCGGTLWEIKDGELVRYQCHVGHGFNSDSLRAGMDGKLEETLWSAVRAIEESIALRTRMREQATHRRLTGLVSALDTEIGSLTSRVHALRELLLQQHQSRPPRKVQPRNTSQRKRRAHG